MRRVIHEWDGIKPCALDMVGGWESRRWRRLHAWRVWWWGRRGHWCGAQTTLSRRFVAYNCRLKCRRARRALRRGGRERTRAGVRDLGAVQRGIRCGDLGCERCRLCRCRSHTSQQQNEGDGLAGTRDVPRGEEPGRCSGEERGGAEVRGAWLRGVAMLVSTTAAGSRAPTTCERKAQAHRGEIASNAERERGGEKAGERE